MSLVCTHTKNNQIMLIPEFAPGIAQSFSIEEVPLPDEVLPGEERLAGIYNYRFIQQSTSFVLQRQVEVGILLVGGGGAGGAYGGGGGGGAGKVVSFLRLLEPGEYNIQIGVYGVSTLGYAYGGGGGETYFSLINSANAFTLNAAGGWGGGAGGGTGIVLPAKGHGGNGGGSGGGSAGASGGNKGSAGNRYSPAVAGTGGGWNDAAYMLRATSLFDIGAGGAPGTPVSTYKGGGGGGGLSLVASGLSNVTGGIGGPSTVWASLGRGGIGYGAGGGGSGANTTSIGGRGAPGLCVLRFAA